MNSANREMNSIFDVNSNLKIIFLLFSAKEAVSKHTLSGITQVCDFWALLSLVEYTYKAGLDVLKYCT